MNPRLDNRILNLQFTYGAGISVSDAQNSLRHINRSVAIVKQSFSVIEPIVEMLQQQFPVEALISEKRSHYLHKILLDNVNNSIATLHTLGCPLGAVLTLETNQNIQDALEDFQNKIKLVHIEIIRSDINYELAATLILQLNQNILKAVKIIRAVVEKNVNEHKWLYIHSKIK
jgi:hypothetical protein